jgi:hypothetical protein
MNALTHRATIAVAIGRDVCLYHAYITTAPSTLDAPATLTLDVGPLSKISAWAADPLVLDSALVNIRARLVLVEESDLEPQRARYREARHLFKPADPVLVGLNTLQEWLWNRLGVSHPYRALAYA